MDQHRVLTNPTLEQILAADAWAREEAVRISTTFCERA